MRCQQFIMLSLFRKHLVLSAGSTGKTTCDAVYLSGAFCSLPLATPQSRLWLDNNHNLWVSDKKQEGTVISADYFNKGWFMILYIVNKSVMYKLILKQTLTFSQVQEFKISETDKKLLFVCKAVVLNGGLVLHPYQGKTKVSTSVIWPIDIW